MLVRTIGTLCMMTALMLTVAPTAADVVNGDFQTGDLANWGANTVNGALTEVVLGYDTNSTYVAHLKTETTYIWDDAGEFWDGVDQQAAIQQGFATIYSLVTGPNEIRLEFDALAIINGEDMLPPSTNVSVAGGFAGGVAVATYIWTTYSFDLIDPATSQPLAASSSINVAFNVTVEAPLRFGDYDGETVVQTNELYLDNIHLVPEPASLMLTAVGAVAVLRRRRR